MISPGTTASAIDITFAFLSAGVMASDTNIERFQRLSDIAISAAV